MPEFWEWSWKQGRDLDYISYAKPYYRLASPEMDIFRRHGTHSVCDAGCGFGAWALALASNGFDVTALDVSQTAVEIARQVLEQYGLGLAGHKTASVLETGYPDGAFDGVVCFSVLDHMTISDAQTALRELRRIIRPGGLLLLAFDRPEEDDLTLEHTLLSDGSIQYANGMIFHPYDAPAAERLLAGLPILYRGTGPKEEVIFVVEK